MEQNFKRVCTFRTERFRRRLGQRSCDFFQILNSMKKRKEKNRIHTKSVERADIPTVHFDANFNAMGTKNFILFIVWLPFNNITVISAVLSTYLLFIGICLALPIVISVTKLIIGNNYDFTGHWALGSSHFQPRLFTFCS